MWKDNFFYPGFIYKQSSDQTVGQYMVFFDDGDSRIVSAAELILASMIKIDQQVLADSGEGYNRLCKILKVFDSGKAFMVQFEDDGTMLRYINIQQYIYSSAQLNFHNVVKIFYY